MRPLTLFTGRRGGAFIYFRYPASILLMGIRPKIYAPGVRLLIPLHDKSPPCPGRGGVGLCIDRCIICLVGVPRCCLFIIVISQNASVNFLWLLLYHKETHLNHKKRGTLYKIICVRRVKMIIKVLLYMYTGTSSASKQPPQIMFGIYNVK